MRLKIDGNWKDAIRRSFKKKKPAEGWLASSSEPPPKLDWRESVIQQTLRDYPTATREEVDEMLTAFGS